MKKEQEESVIECCKGRDVFVSLPTGYGKSLCYVLLPCVFDILRKVEKKSIALIVSSLVALMQDQVAGMSVSATYVYHGQGGY